MRAIPEPNSAKYLRQVQADAREEARALYVAKAGRVCRIRTTLGVLRGVQAARGFVGGENRYDTLGDSLKIMVTHVDSTFGFIWHVERDDLHVIE